MLSNSIEFFKKIAVADSAKAKEILLSKLNDDDKLNLRAVNHYFNDLVKTNITAPYTTKKAFTAGTTGLYKDKKYFAKAWELYNNTLSSSSFKPAALYKMKDWEGLFKNGKIRDFADHENLGVTGRIYCPGDVHVWSVNRSWLLAQFHKGRSFQLLSEVNVDVKLSDNPLTFSSFAKEITSVLQAGYEITDIDWYDIKLSPLPAKPLLTIWDVAPKPLDIASRISIFKESYVQHFNAIKSADNILNLFKNLPENVADVSISDYFVNPVNNRLYVQSVLRTLNNKFPYCYFKTVPDNCVDPSFDYLAWMKQSIQGILEQLVARRYPRKNCV